MRLPFLQVEADLIGQRGQVAAKLLGVSLPMLVGLVTLVRAYALSLAGDEAPDGWVLGVDAGQVLELAAGWEGESGKLIQVLSMPSVRLLEVDDGAIRVGGMEPYQQAHERNAKARARFAKHQEKNAKLRVGNAPLRGKTETETETEIEATASQETAGAVPVADDIPHAEEGDVQWFLPAGMDLCHGGCGHLPEHCRCRPAEKPEALQAAWNQHAHVSLPRWQGMSEKRRRSAAARLRERPLAAWVGVIQRLSASSFCRGEERGSSWRASPDWLLQPDVADKVLEGKYDRQAAPERHLGIAPPPGAPTAEDRRRAHQEYLAREAEKKAAGGAS